MSWNEKIKFDSKKNNIVLIGEVLVDVIQDTTGDYVYTKIGGSPFNISRNLTKLDIPNIFYGSVGNDVLAEDICKHIEAKNIKAQINRTNKVTSFVKMDKSLGTPNPEFHRSSDNYIYLTDKLVDDIKNAKILHFTYWPIALEPSRSTILEAIDIARENNTIIGFDPNYHPELDDEKTSGFNVIKDIISKVDIIKPSLDDSYRMFGERTVEQYLNIYEEMGAKLIIMTLGKDGLAAKYKGQYINLPSFATEVLDTTGAGDAFWCGLYAGITTDCSILESVKIGLQCAAYSLKEIGSEIDFPELAIIKKILGE